MPLKVKYPRMFSNALRKESILNQFGAWHVGFEFIVDKRVVYLGD